LAHFDLISTPFGPDFRSKKKLALPISRGKNFGGVFFDAFRKSKQESENIVTIDTSVAEISNYGLRLSTTVIYTVMEPVGEANFKK